MIQNTAFVHDCRPSRFSNKAESVWRQGYPILFSLFKFYSHSIFYLSENVKVVVVRLFAVRFQFTKSHILSFHNNFNTNRINKAVKNYSYTSIILLSHILCCLSLSTVFYLHSTLYNVTGQTINRSCLRFLAS